MNSKNKKAIKDANEERKGKYDTIFLTTGIFFTLTGIILLFVKGMSVEYIDTQGMLHENFFLIPIGFLFVFSGAVTFFIAGIRTIIKKFKNES